MRAIEYSPGMIGRPLSFLSVKAWETKLPGEYTLEFVDKIETSHPSLELRGKPDSIVAVFFDDLIT